MNDLSVRKNLAPHKLAHKVRFVTAASLFDGHDASINIMRRILQGSGAEVIHLGHNRSVGCGTRRRKPWASRRSTMLVTDVGWIISRSPIFPRGSDPLRENCRSTSAS